MTKQRTFQNCVNCANAHRIKCTILGITAFLLLVNVFGVGFVQERATIGETRPVPSSTDDYFMRAREQLRSDGTIDDTETDILLQLLSDNQHQSSTGSVTHISFLTVYSCTVGVTGCHKEWYGMQNLSISILYILTMIMKQKNHIMEQNRTETKVYFYRLFHYIQ